jgi:hypothetical protein
VPAQLEAHLARLRDRMDGDAWQELCPLVQQARELADQLEPQASPSPRGRARD